MSKENKTIVLVSSPQTSKSADLGQIDLLEHPVYRNMVRRVDRAVEKEDDWSLSVENQFASVVNSIASHCTFSHELRERVQPGKISPGDLGFKFGYMGHSVGEMAAIVEAGYLYLETMAQILYKRQEITEEPFLYGARFMLAGVGIDPKKFEKALEKRVKDNFGDKVKAAVANKNTPSQVVVSVEAVEGEPSIWAGKFGDIFKDFGHFEAKRPPRFILLPVKNAFHFWILKPQELLLERAIAPLLARVERVDKGSLVYSPMLNNWIRSDKDVRNIINHQLTWTVEFSEGVEKLVKDPNLAVFVTGDIGDTTPKMLRDNLLGRKQVLNVNSLETLNQAVEEAVTILRS